MDHDPPPPRSPPRGRRRVGVVGGGVVGCAVAYRLGHDGFDVTLFERDAIAHHASGQSAGNLNPLLGTPSALLPFALKSFALHRDLRLALLQGGWLANDAAPVRRLHVGFSDADRPELEGIAALFGAQPGFAARWVDLGDMARMEPRLSSCITSAVLTEGNLSIDSLAFTRALAEGAAAMGARIVLQAATGLATKGGRVTGVRTADATTPCELVVLATGPWVAAPGAWLGIDIPVEPLKGEMLLMRVPGGPPPFDCSWGPTSLYRRREDQVWVGTTWADTGFAGGPTDAARRALLERATEMMPAMQGATLLEHNAALRPMVRRGTRGALPLAEAAPGWENVFLANGGGAKGILLCAGIADAIAACFERTDTK